MWTWFEDEYAFAKYHDLNPFAAAILAELAIHNDRGSRKVRKGRKGTIALSA